MNSRKRYFIYAALFLITLINYVDRINLSVAAGAIAQEFQLSTVQMGFVFSAYLWTYTLCLLPVGVIVDRWGPYLISGISLVLWSIAGAASGLVETLGMLIATRLVLGIGEASIYPANSRIVRDWAPPAERGLATSIFNSGAYAGLALGALLVGWLVTEYGWRASFYVTGGAGLVLAVFWFALIKPPSTGLTVKPASVAREPILPLLRSLLKSKSMWGVAIAQFCAGYGLYFLMSWMPKYLETGRGITLLKTGLFTAVPYAVAAILSLVVGYLSDVAIRRRGGAASTTRRGFVTALLLLASTVALVPMMSELWMVTILLCIAVTCVSSVVGLNVALTNDLMTSAASAGMAVSFLILGGNLAGIVAPIITGYAIAGRVGFDGAFYLAGAVMFLGAIAAWSMTRKAIEIAAAPNSPPLAFSTETV
jgi:MFS family permease